MGEQTPLAMVLNPRLTPPNYTRKTMDPKFIVVLFCVEAGALVFTSLHVTTSAISLYNAYNEEPVIHNHSSVIYYCFTDVNHCIYEHNQLYLLKIFHVAFILIIVLCYLCLFIIILRKWENSRVCEYLGITWYGAIQLLVLLTLALNSLLMVILFERDHSYIHECNEVSRLVRTENLFTYIVLSLLEMAYIGFDILNRQASIHALHQAFEYRARAAEKLSSNENCTIIKRPFRSRSTAESFETVNEDITQPNLSNVKTLFNSDCSSFDK